MCQGCRGLRTWGKCCYMCVQLVTGRFVVSCYDWAFALGGGQVRASKIPGQLVSPAPPGHNLDM